MLTRNILQTQFLEQRQATRRALAEKWIKEQRDFTLNRQYDNYPDENNFAGTNANHARTATDASVTLLKKTSAEDRVSSAKQSRKRKPKRATLKKLSRKSDSENKRIMKPPYIRHLHVREHLDRVL